MGCVFEDLKENEEVDCFQECPVKFACDSETPESEFPTILLAIIKNAVDVALKHERNHEINITE